MLASLFHPAVTSRVLSVQGLLSPRSHPSSSEGACPRAVDSPSLHSLTPAFAKANALPTCDAPRLRGFYLRKAAFHKSGYSPRPCPLPSSVSSPPGSFFSRRRRCLTQHLPLMMFASWVFTSSRSPFSARDLRSPYGSRASYSPSPVHLQRLVIKSSLVDSVSDFNRPARVFEPSIRNPGFP